MQWGGLAARIKFGGVLDRSRRTFRQRRFEYQEGREIDYRDLEGDTDEYFDGDNFGMQDTLEAGELVAYNAGLYILENSQKRTNYDASCDVQATYAMSELPLSMRFRVVGGMCVETTEMRTESLDAAAKEEQRIGRMEETDLLPSLNVVVQLMANMNLRASATRTLARPTYSDLASSLLQNS